MQKINTSFIRYFIMNVGQYLATSLSLLIIGLGLVISPENSLIVRIVFTLFGILLIIAAFVVIIRMIRKFLSG